MSILSKKRAEKKNRRTKDAKKKRRIIAAEMRQIYNGRLNCEGKPRRFSVAFPKQKKHHDKKACQI